MYGGTRRGNANRSPAGGLSPRVRGNRGAARLRAYCRRSIPACTGEPRCRCPEPRRSAVYPRVYGGTIVGIGQRPRLKGLSPRVRGNHGISNGNDVLEWSIPACTGEPYEVIGATAGQGSIPACTGEPWTVFRAGTQVEVYPRVYGGTCTRSAVAVLVHGLSPRVRGNPGILFSQVAQLRSIPACTGEPTRRWSCCRHPEVYPRVYGGTQPGCPGRHAAHGLSPRVRGNPGCPRSQG